MKPFAVHSSLLARGAFYGSLRTLMLYDRPYMREPASPPPSNPIKPIYWLMGGIIGTYALQAVFRYPFDLIFALSSSALSQGNIYPLLTYSFLHGGFFHILFNCLMLYWLGRTLLPLFGAKSFYTLYGISVLLGGIAWLAANSWRGDGALLMGASAGVAGLLVAFALLYPNRPLQFLLFFFLPIRITPRNLILIVLAIDSIGFLIGELPLLAQSVSPIAHSAHLGGMLGGWLFYKFVLSGNFPLKRSSKDVSPPKWFTNKKAKRAVSGRFRIKFSNREALQNEVDRILDKINAQGFASLSKEEKRTLDEAKEILNR